MGVPRAIRSPWRRPRPSPLRIQRLRGTSRVAIIREIGVLKTGRSNIQFRSNPAMADVVGDRDEPSGEPPRALAFKGPLASRIAKIGARLGGGDTLDEFLNDIHRRHPGLASSPDRLCGHQDSALRLSRYSRVACGAEHLDEGRWGGDWPSAAASRNRFQKAVRSALKPAWRLGLWTAR